MSIIGVLNRYVLQLAFCRLARNTGYRFPQDATLSAPVLSRVPGEPGAFTRAWTIEGPAPEAVYWYSLNFGVIPFSGWGAKPYRHIPGGPWSIGLTGIKAEAEV